MCDQSGVNVMLKFLDELKSSVYRLQWDLYLAPQHVDQPTKWKEHSWVFVHKVAAQAEPVQPTKRPRSDDDGSEAPPPEEGCDKRARRLLRENERLQAEHDGCICVGMAAVGRVSREQLVVRLEALLQTATAWQAGVDSLLRTAVSRDQRHRLETPPVSILHPLLATTWTERHTAHLDDVVTAFRFKARRHLREQLHSVLCDMAAKVKARLFLRVRQRLNTPRAPCLVIMRVRTLTENEAGF